MSLTPLQDRFRRTRMSMLVYAHLFPSIIHSLYYPPLALCVSQRTEIT